MDIQVFSISDISKVAEVITSLSNTIDRREKWQNMARKALRLNQNVTLRQVALFTKSYETMRKRMLSESFETWKNHIKWRRFSNQIILKCRVFIFKHLAQVLANNRRKSKQKMWVRMAKKVVEYQRKEEISESYRELVDIRSAMNILEKWHVFKAAAKLIRKQVWQEYAEKCVKKDKKEKLIAGKKEIETAKKWRHFVHESFISEIHKAFEEYQHIEELREKWNEIASLASIKHMKEVIELTNKWNAFARCVKKMDIQESYNKYQELMKKWNEVEKELRNKHQKEMLEKGLNTIKMMNKWKSLSDRNVGRLRKLVLKAGREYLTQIREKRASRLIGKKMITKWATYTRSRNYTRNLFNKVTDIYSISFQNNAAAMIQAVFRGFMERKKFRAVLFTKQRAFNVWRAMIIVRRKAHTRLPQIMQDVPVPVISIPLPKIDTFENIDQSVNRLESLRDILDLKIALKKAQEEESFEEETLPEQSEPELKDIEIQPDNSGLTPTLEQSITTILEYQSHEDSQDNVFSTESSVFSTESEDSLNKEQQNVFSDESEEEEEEEEKVEAKEEEDSEVSLSPVEDEKPPLDYMNYLFKKHQRRNEPVKMVEIIEPEEESEPEPEPMNDSEAEKAISFISFDDVDADLIKFDNPINRFEHIEIPEREIPVPEMTDEEALEALSFFSFSDVNESLAANPVSLDRFQKVKIPEKIPELTDEEAMKSVAFISFDNVNSDLTKFELESLADFEAVKIPEEKVEPLTEEEAYQIASEFTFDDVDKSLIDTECSSLYNFGVKPTIPKELKIDDDIINDIANNLFSFDNILKTIAPKEKPRKAAPAPVPVEKPIEPVVEEEEHEEEIYSSDMEEVANNVVGEDEYIDSLKPKAEMLINNFTTKPEIPSSEEYISDSYVEEETESDETIIEDEVLDNVSEEIVSFKDPIASIKPEFSGKLSFFVPKPTIPQKEEEEEKSELVEEESIKEYFVEEEESTKEKFVEEESEEEEDFIDDEEMKEVSENIVSVKEPIMTIKPQFTNKLSFFKIKPEIPKPKPIEVKIDPQEAKGLIADILNDILQAINLEEEEIVEEEEEIIEQAKEEEEIIEEIKEEEEIVEQVKAEEEIEEEEEEIDEEMMKEVSDEIVSIKEPISNIKPTFNTNLFYFTHKPTIPSVEEEEEEIAEEEEEISIEPEEAKGLVSGILEDTLELVKLEEEKEVEEEEEEETKTESIKSESESEAEFEVEAKVEEEEEEEEEISEETTKDVSHKVFSSNDAIESLHPTFTTTLSFFKPKPEIPQEEVEIPREEAEKIVSSITKETIEETQLIKEASEEEEKEPFKLNDSNESAFEDKAANALAKLSILLDLSDEGIEEEEFVEEEMAKEKAVEEEEMYEEEEMEEEEYVEEEEEEFVETKEEEEIKEIPTPKIEEMQEEEEKANHSVISSPSRVHRVKMIMSPPRVGNVIAISKSDAINIVDSLLSGTLNEVRLIEEEEKEIDSSDTENIANGVIPDESIIKELEPKFATSLDNFAIKPTVPEEVEEEEEEIDEEMAKDISNRVSSFEEPMNVLKPEIFAMLSFFRPKPEIPIEIQEEEEIVESKEEEEIVEAKEEEEIVEAKEEEEIVEAKEEEEIVEAKEEEEIVEAKEEEEIVEAKEEEIVEAKEEEEIVEAKEEEEIEDISSSETEQIANNVASDEIVNEIKPILNKSLDNFVIKPTIPEAIEEEEEEEINIEKEDASNIVSEILHNTLDSLRFNEINEEESVEEENIEIIEEEKHEEEIVEAKEEEEEEEEITEELTKEVRENVVSFEEPINSIAPKFLSNLSFFKPKPVIPTHEEEESVEFVEEEEKEIIEEEEAVEEKEQEIVESFEEEEINIEQEQASNIISEILNETIDSVKLNEIKEEESVSEKIEEEEMKEDKVEEEEKIEIIEEEEKHEEEIVEDKEEEEEEEITEELTKEVRENVVSFEEPMNSLAPAISSYISFFKPKPVIPTHEEESIVEEEKELKVEEESTKEEEEKEMAVEEEEEINIEPEQASKIVSDILDITLSSVKLNEMQEEESVEEEKVEEEEQKETIESNEEEAEEEEEIDEEVNKDITSKVCSFEEPVSSLKPMISNSLSFFKPKPEIPILKSEEEEFTEETKEEEEIASEEEEISIDSEEAKGLISGILKDTLELVKLEEEKVIVEEESIKESVEEEEEETKTESIKSESESEAEVEVETKVEEEEEEEISEETTKDVSHKVFSSNDAIESLHPTFTTTLSFFKPKPEIPQEENHEEIKEEEEAIEEIKEEEKAHENAVEEEEENKSESKVEEEEEEEEIDEETAKDISDKVVSFEKATTSMNPNLSATLSFFKPKPEIPQQEAAEEKKSSVLENESFEDKAANALAKLSILLDLSDEEEEEEEIDEFVTKNVSENVVSFDESLSSLKPSFRTNLNDFTYKPSFDTYEYEYEEEYEEEEENISNSVSGRIVSFEEPISSIAPTFRTNLDNFSPKPTEESYVIASSSSLVEDEGEKEIVRNESANFDLSSLIC